MVAPITTHSITEMPMILRRHGERSAFASEGCGGTVKLGISRSPGLYARSLLLLVMMGKWQQRRFKVLADGLRCIQKVSGGQPVKRTRVVWPTSTSP